MSIDHQTAIAVMSLPGLGPAHEPRPRSPIWLVMIGAILGAGMQLGVTTAIHHVHAEQHRLAIKHQRVHMVALWHAHHAAPAMGRYTFRRN